MSCVRIACARPNPRLSLSGLKKTALQLLSTETREHSSVDIILTTDSHIRKLNRAFRKKDKPTDVLSFNFDDPDLLGEIYISLDTAKKQAKEIGHPLFLELRRLMVHGLFHLLGYDHHNASDRAKMERKESKYI